MSYRDILFLKDSELLPGVMTIIYDLVEVRRREIALEKGKLPTPSQVAKEIGVTSGMLNSMMKGLRRPTPLPLALVTDYFGVTTYDVMQNGQYKDLIKHRKVKSTYTDMSTFYLIPTLGSDGDMAIDKEGNLHRKIDGQWYDLNIMVPEGHTGLKRSN